MMDVFVNALGTELAALVERMPEGFTFSANTSTALGLAPVDVRLVRSDAGVSDAGIGEL